MHAPTAPRYRAARREASASNSSTGHTASASQDPSLHTVRAAGASARSQPLRLPRDRGRTGTACNIRSAEICTINYQRARSKAAARSRRVGEPVQERWHVQRRNVGYGPSARVLHVPIPHARRVLRACATPPHPCTLLVLPCPPGQPSVDHVETGNADMRFQSNPGWQYSCAPRQCHQPQAHGWALALAAIPPCPCPRRRPSRWRLLPHAVLRTLHRTPPRHIRIGSDGAGCCVCRPPKLYVLAEQQLGQDAQPKE